MSSKIGKQMETENTYIEIGNNGQEITDTNYWYTPHAQKGHFYLSWNAGAARLLVPRSQLSTIDEMKTGKLVIISRGEYENRDALELLFEDYTDTPYFITLVTDQTDRLLPASDAGSEFVFSVWTENGKQFTLKAMYRTVGKLPFLNP